MLSKKKFPALAMPKTGGIVLLPERPEELLDPSQRFVKSPKSSRTSLSPVSSPKSLSGEASPMLAPQVRTSFWNSKKANQLSKPSKPSPPSQKKTIAQYNSPKLNKVVSSNDGPDLETNEEIKSTGKQTITGNRRRGRRSSVVHLGGMKANVNDHHRVHELYAQLRDMVHRKRRSKRPEDSDKGSDSESDLSSDSDDEATADREIILKHKDANDLLNALAEFRILLSIGSFNVHDPDHVEAKTVLHIVGEYSRAKRKEYLNETRKAIALQRQKTIGIRLQDTIFQALGTLHKHIPLKLSDENFKRMQGCGSWEFDILHLADDLGGHTLPTVAHVCFNQIQKRNLDPNAMQYDTQTLIDYMGEIESLYKDENEYHNSSHVSKISS